jgi:osmotically-inducible protein OsmY
MRSTFTCHYAWLLIATATIAEAQLPPDAEPPAAGDAGPGATPPARTTKVSDAQLGLEVQARLYQELDIASNLSALVRYGVVTLDGTVKTEADRERAAELARTVPGIESVVNELVVGEIPTFEDPAAAAERDETNLEEAVTSRLRYDPIVGSRNIRVLADELTRTVTLTGVVGSEEEKERAGRIAVGAFAAGNVRNQLEVQD